MSTYPQKDVEPVGDASTTREVEDRQGNNAAKELYISSSSLQLV